MRVYINWLDSFADNEEVLGSSPSTRTNETIKMNSTRDEERRSHFVYTEGFTTQVRVLPRRPGRIVQSLTEQRETYIRNDIGYVTKVGEICLQLHL